MTHDQRVGMHRVQRHRRVDQRLALMHRARRDRHVDNVAAEPLSCYFERRAGARRVFEETADDRPAAQQCAFLLGLAIELDITVRQIEEVIYFLRRQAFDAEKMAVPESAVAGSTLHELRTIGRTFPTGKSSHFYCASRVCREERFYQRANRRSGVDSAV